MSSETSTDAELLPTGSDRTRAKGAEGFRVWQLFTLAALITASAVAFLARTRPSSVRVTLILTVFGAAAMGVAALRALSPLTGGGGPVEAPTIGGRTRAALEREKTLALRSIKELEFDRAMGKVSEKDFTEMSARLRARAARILRELDAGTGYRDQIEREVTRRLSAGGSGPGAAGLGMRVPDQIEPQRPSSTDVREAPTPLTVPLCRQCGTANDADARFCKSCGQRIGDA
jgi:hypothetical protein